MSKGPTTSRARRLAQLGRMAGGQGVRHLAMQAANLTRDEEQRMAALERRQYELADRLVTMLGNMRGAAMKVGQSLSIVDFGLIPAEYRDEFQRKLAALQDRAPNVPWKKMKAQIEKGLGEDLDEVFAEFEETPVAAASIGQVYRARLHDGTRVAVKVQYPGIATAVRADIKNLRLIAPAAKAVAPGIDLEAIINEVEERVFEELDYEHEASNHRIFARHYRDHPFIRVPGVYTRLCSDTVIVTDWIDGRPMASAESLDQEARNRIAEIIFRFYMSGPHDLLLFSGDPHPGNSLLLDDGSVGFLDFGLLKRIDRKTSDLEKRAARAIAEGDADTLVACFADQGLHMNPDRISADMLLDNMLETQGWFLEDDAVELTPTVTNAIAAFASDLRGPIYRIFKGQPLPPAHMVQRRVEIQVLSIIGQLRPIVNFHDISREWFADAEPVTELGRLHAEWRDRRAVAA